MSRSLPKFLLPATLCVLASSCTLISVDSQEGPPGAHADGLIDGHAVFGWRAEKGLLRAELLDGTSSGALFEISVWKLLRLEAGLAGVCVGIGPFDVGIGTLFFSPVVPTMMQDSKPKPAEPAPNAAPAPTETTPSTTPPAGG